MMTRKSRNFPVPKEYATIEEQAQCSSALINESITFDYKLNEKSAKNKLVKVAKKIPFEIQENTSSSNLVFSAGAWKVAVIPAIQYWNQIKGEQTCKVGDVLINVSGIRSDKDSIGNTIVNQIVFLSDRDKIVCHLYNTTCLILVNGHGYQRFIDIFLKPFFQAKLEASFQQIQDINNEVIQKCGPKTVKRADIKFRKGYAFPCTRCDYGFKSNSELNNHKFVEHALSFNSTKKSPLPRQSTRNSSLTSCIMLENMTIPNSDVSITLDEVSQKNKVGPPFTCDWDPCNYKSKERPMLMKHIDEHLGKTEK